jgi:uncharacterized protein YigE (DUF2233 family)
VRRAASLLALLLGGCLSAAEPTTATSAAGGACRPVTFEGTAYRVCEVDLTRDRLGLFWRDRDGRAYGSLAALESAQPRGGETLLFAMNAGMYEADLSPVGLFVAGGVEEKPANTADGAGNFYLKPNGVFYVTADGAAGILETGSYLAAAPEVALATQSGPLMLAGGAIHPRFEADGASRKIRNGVGLRDPRHVVFAIALQPVSFGSFARLFRDGLGCQDALYLDGSISALSEPGHAPVGGGERLGPILAAFGDP